MAVSLVTRTGWPPLTPIVQMSRWAPSLGRPQYAILPPPGDHDGSTASPAVRMRRSPEATVTIESGLVDSLTSGVPSTRSPANTIDLPSGDQDGLKPSVVNRRTASPVLFITNSP